MATAASTGPDIEGSLRSLLGDVVDHVRSLVRLEVALAKAEVRRAVVSLRRGALLMGAGVLLGSLGLLSLVAALIGGLSTVWPFWLAATVVGIVFAAVGGALGRMALSGLKLEGVRPSATFETLEETKAWLKSRA
jgi:uncharacterized membrane protein YqjE